MPKQFGSQLDLQKIPVLNIVVQSMASPGPTSPTNGQLWYDTTNNLLKAYENGGWVTLSSAGGSSPTGSAGGDLSGSYPNPTIGSLKITTGMIQDSQITSAKIADGTITDADVASANKDGIAATVSMRSIGTGALQALAGNTRLDQVSSPTASVNMNSQRIVSLLDPTGAQDAATKNYVDNLAAGLDAKASVRLVATSSAAGGVAPTGAATIDGSAVVTGDRILLTAQSPAQHNGIWIANTAGAWTRPTDFDDWLEVPSAYVWVEIGATYSDTGWVCTADAGGTIGTTVQAWTQFTASTTVVAGAGLLKTGNTFDVGGTANRITVATDTVDIASTYVGQASITTLGTITTGVWTGTAIAVANGGTGSTTAAGARSNLGAVTKYAADVGALVAGVETTVTHSLGTKDVVVAFRVNSTDRDIILDWRATGTNTIGVTADVAYSSGDIRVVVLA